MHDLVRLSDLLGYQLCNHVAARALNLKGLWSKKLSTEVTPKKSDVFTLGKKFRLLLPRTTASKPLSPQCQCFLLTVQHIRTFEALLLLGIDMCILDDGKYATRDCRQCVEQCWV